MKIILASGSPRRRELLSQIGVPFEVWVSDADENVQEKSPAKLVEKLSERKARAVFETAQKQHPSKEKQLYIGADTVVCYRGEILGKPKDKLEAYRMVKLLQGKKHQVYTGVTLLYGKKKASFHEKTDVVFFEMTEQEILHYVEEMEKPEWTDKAGGYAIQGFFARYIKEIKGDYNNVVGLPVGRLYQEMKRLLKDDFQVDFKLN